MGISTKQEPQQTITLTETEIAYILDKLTNLDLYGNHEGVRKVIRLLVGHLMCSKEE